MLVRKVAAVKSNSPNDYTFSILSHSDFFVRVEAAVALPRKKEALFSDKASLESEPEPRFAGF